MRFALPITVIVGVAAAFVLQVCGHTFYVNHYEFNPAVVEWNEAYKRSDTPAMRRAYRKEEIAHCRTIDLFWFVPGLWNDCGEELK